MQALSHAIHAAVHHSGITTAHLAELMGVRHQTLINKANPNGRDHRMTVDELVDLMRYTGNTRPLEVLCIMFDGKFVRTVVEPGRGSIIDAALRAAAEGGDVQRAVVDARADGRYTNRERAEIITQAQEAIAAMETLIREVANG